MMVLVALAVFPVMVSSHCTIIKWKTSGFSIDQLVKLCPQRLTIINPHQIFMLFSSLDWLNGDLRLILSQMHNYYFGEEKKEKNIKLVCVPAGNELSVIDLFFLVGPLHDKDPNLFSVLCLSMTCSLVAELAWVMINTFPTDWIGSCNIRVLCIPIMANVVYPRLEQACTAASIVVVGCKEKEGLKLWFGTWTFVFMHGISYLRGDEQLVSLSSLVNSLFY